VVAVVFVVGLSAGTAVSSDCALVRAWTPWGYLQTLNSLAHSPWSWVDPDLQENIRATKRELCAAAVIGVLTTGAYVAGGPGLALKTMGAAAHLSGGKTGSSALRLFGQVPCPDDDAPEPEWVEPRRRRGRRQRQVRDQAPEAEDTEGNTTQLVPSTVN
jgi:hypothetical protein